MSTNSLVSVIVPTKNSAQTLEACLQSIADQTYDAIELIVVDNYSDDATSEIAHRFTKNVFEIGPERCAQRNYGVKQARGEYAVFIDSDMELAPKVIAEAVLAHRQEGRAVVIPEESFGKGYWAACKRLERSFYVGVNWIEAARFFSIKEFNAVGGYDEALVSGEDWDLSQRVLGNQQAARIKQYIYHNEGKLSLLRTLRKKYYYSSKILEYGAKNASISGKQFSPLQRYKLFFSKPQRLLAKPHIAIGMLFMKTMEYAAGAVGLLRSKLQRS